ncbi:tetratricopeptide repeat protein [Streptomyces prunicolor]
MGELQASIDWGETGSVERSDYNVWASQHVSRLVEEGCIEELRTAASTGTALARARLAEIYAAQGRIEELRALAGSENEGLELLLADSLAGQDDLEAKVAVMKVRLQVDEEDARDELIELLRAQGRIDEAITFLQRYAHEYVEWNLLVRLLLLQGRVKDVQLMAYEERAPVATRAPWWRTTSPSRGGSTSCGHSSRLTALWVSLSCWPAHWSLRGASTRGSRCCRSASTPTSSTPATG